MWPSNQVLKHLKRYTPFSSKKHTNNYSYSSWLSSSFPLSNGSHGAYRYEALSGFDADEEPQLDISPLSPISLEYRDLPQEKRLKGVCVLAGLYLTTNLFYLLSLRGAESAPELATFLGSLGAFLVAAVISYSIQFWMSTVFLNIPSWWRAFNALLQFSTIGFWYLFDNGNRLQSHGAFNLLIFCVILVPSNTLIGSLYFWYIVTSTNEKKRPRRFWSQFFTAASIGAVVLMFVAAKKKNELTLGFFDKQAPCSAEERTSSTCRSCQWNSAMPWFDLLPIRLNAFVGPMTCPKDDSFSAYFDDKDKLTIECKSLMTDARSWFNDSVILSHAGAIYTKLPRTETWGFKLKEDSLDIEVGSLQKNVLRFAEAHLKPYKGPTSIDDNTDTVLAFCGSSSPKIVNRFITADDFDEVSEHATLLQHSNNDKLNVVTLFIDAVSRRHFHRKLPMTRKAIESSVSSHSSTSTLFEFFRYHKIAFNTEFNTRALWAGLDEHDPHSTGTPLWEQYHAAGYRSARIDPMCQDWSAYYDPGHFANSTEPNSDFIKPRLSREYLAWSCFPPSLPIGKHVGGNFHGPTSINAHCFAGTYVGTHELDWASEFIKSTSRTKHSRPYYLNAAFMEGHEGSGEVLRTLDERLAAFLDPATSPIDMNNTAIVLVSDHGALMGVNFAFFENGRVEAANPMAIMMLPQWFVGDSGREKRLRDASGKLVTAHDLYETMKGFMDVDKAEEAESGSGFPVSQKEKKEDERQPRRGFDLLRQSLPDRNCAQAGITETPCKCL